jgi:hypothetical protein
MRTRSFVVAAVAALSLGACASEDPWLKPRSELQHERAVAPAPAPMQPISALPRPEPASPVFAQATDGDSIAALQAREKVLADRYYEMREARQASTTLLAALQAFERDPADARRERVERALATYRTNPALNKLGGVALVLELKGAGASGGAIRTLQAEDQRLADQVAVLQEARKANIALVTALQQAERDGGSAKSRAAVNKARSAYDSARARVE